MTFKMTRQNLRDLIVEELTYPASVLLESPPEMGSSPINQPVMNAMGPGESEEDPIGPGADTRQQLYHISQQSQQLHDMLADTEELSAAVATKIAKAAQILELAFKTITYDKGPGQGQVGE
jgi:hypothetical protein